MYQKNLQTLKERAPDIHNTLETATPLFSLQVEKTPTDAIRVGHGEKKCLLHSEYSIEEEMEWMLHKVASNTEIIVIFGLGAGHCIKAIMNKFPKIRHIIVVEPTVQIFKTILAEQDFAKLIAPVGQVHFTLLLNHGAKQMVDVIRTLILLNAKVEIVAHLAYRSLFAEYYQRFYVAMIESIRETTIQLCTLYLTQEIFLGNTLQNFAVPTYSCETFEKFFINKPVVIVSAGPSLKKNMHLLAEAKGKAIIIAVGTAIKILNMAGIRPHFYSAIDPGSEEKALFRDLKYPDVPLLFGNQINDAIVAEYPAPMIRFIMNTDFFGQYMYDIAGRPVVLVTSGPSVADVTLSLLCNMKCSTVIFVGQDMCMQNDKIHALGADVKQDYSNDALLPVKDIYGNDVNTLACYWVIKAQLEMLIAQYPNILFINATEGGVGMQGARNELFADVLATMKPLAIDIDAEFGAIVKEQGNGPVDFQPSLMQGCFHDEIDAITKIIDRVTMLLQANAVLLENKSPRNKKKIDKNLQSVERNMAKLHHIKFYKEVVFQSVIHILITVSNIHHSDSKDENWDVRTKGLTEIWGGYISAIMGCCTFIKDRLSKKYSDA